MKDALENEFDCTFSFRLPTMVMDGNDSQGLLYINHF